MECLTLEMPANDRLACPADENYDVNPCVRIRNGRHNCIGAIGRERNLTKQMIRMGSFTSMVADSDYREKKHTKRRSRPMDIVKKELSRNMVTPKKKGRDADKNVYSYAILKYQTA